MNKNGMTGSSTGVDDKMDSIKDTVKSYVDQGAQTVDAIKSRVVEVKDQAVNRGNDVLAQMTDLIKAHPFKAVGIAFGAGYIGMRLFRR
jgi:ElaB/YqjD/DUF883 family membrane-anchored ribosome-binding protein